MVKFALHHTVIILMYVLLYVILQWDLLQLINISFLVGLIALVMFSIIKILESGFFSLFTAGFSKLKQIVFPTSNAMKRVERQIEKDVSYQHFNTRRKRYIIYWLSIICIDSFIISLINLFVFV